MKIIVCVKEVVDSGLNLGFGRVSEELWQEGLARRLNPPDAGALAEALGFKEKNARVEITLISIGPERVERYLRDGLALGADRAVRVWEEDLGELAPYIKAVLLSKAVSLFGADLVLTGDKSLDTGQGQVGQLLAARLGLPCVGEAVELKPDPAQKGITVIKDTGRGTRESRHCPLPAVITVKGEGKLPYASLDRLLESRDSEVRLLSPADLDISPAELNSSPIRVTGLSFPRPRPKKVPTPESSLPAFYRILKLLEGGIPGRQGEMLRGDSDELVNRLFELLLEEEVIRPAGEQDAAG